MNIAITFRQLEASEAVKQYAHEKVAKLQKFLRKPINAQVILSNDKLLHVADVQIQAGSESFRGTEKSEDMYASIDKVIDKLDVQIRKSKESVHAKKKGGEGIKDMEIVEPSDAE